jgi:signal peptidase I
MIGRITSRLSPTLRPWVETLAYLLLALIVAWLVASFAFRTFVVHGISMEPTLKSGDVVLANELGRTLTSLTGHSYIPKRGQPVVFKNPFYNQGDPNAFIVKRVIGLPNDRVVVRDGRISVYPAGSGDSINPDQGLQSPQQPTSGSVNRVVPENEVFVVGDNRLGNNSLDSRNGMSTVPVGQLRGNAFLLIWPPSRWSSL